MADDHHSDHVRRFKAGLPECEQTILNAIIALANAQTYGCCGTTSLLSARRYRRHRRQHGTEQRIACVRSETSVAPVIGEIDANRKHDRARLGTAGASRGGKGPAVPTARSDAQIIAAMKAARRRDLIKVGKLDKLLRSMNAGG
jgi:hypothetical protein